MTVRHANTDDIPQLLSLLSQVLSIHHEGRPDIFKKGSVKYTKEELANILSDDSRPVFVAADERNVAVGYCFCIFKEEKNNNILTDIKTLYIDDLCVDESLRSSGIGRALYECALETAKAAGCYNVTLNVWALNDSAAAFYEKLGMTPQKICMEKIL